MLNIKSFHFNPFGSCCVVAWDETKQAIIFDPGCISDEELAVLFDFVGEKELVPVLVLLTHAHFDHIYGLAATVRKYDVPVVMDAKEKTTIENNKYFCNDFGIPIPDNSFAEGEWREYAAWNPDNGPHPAVLTITEGDLIEWGDGRKWEVLSTPGHTPGGVSFLDREAKLIVGGDTLFAGSIGRTDNRWGDYDALINSIFTRLMVLDGDITVIPGHGGPTTIGEERAKNPFLMPFNEEYNPEEGEEN